VLHLSIFGMNVRSELLVYLLSVMCYS